MDMVLRGCLHRGCRAGQTLLQEWDATSLSDNINQTASHLFPAILPVGVIANWVLERKLQLLNIAKSI